MPTALLEPIKLHDCAPPPDDFRAEVLNGLSSARKSLPCKFFYDARGSALFDEICRLEEYYPTRTEAGIMCRHGAEMAKHLGTGCLLIEYGSGSSTKTPILLDCLDRPVAYMPIDIARDHLLAAAMRLTLAYPDLEVLPVCADYTQPFTLPRPSLPETARNVFFPGSTIGNFLPRQAQVFLQQIATVCGAGGGLLIGVDLRKDASILEPAYNDALGVTAEFNLNLLHRINGELDADFDVSQFQHRAIYDSEIGRIEMHLISRVQQQVAIGATVVEFSADESILTEYSCKYNLDEFAALAAGAGFAVEQVWMDEQRLFSVQFLRVG